MSAQTAITNTEFASRIGCSESMASRLLNGQRVAGLDLMQAIHEQYRIPWAKLLEARNAGPEAFGELLRSRVKPAPKAA